MPDHLVLVTLIFRLLFDPLLLCPFVFWFFIPTLSSSLGPLLFVFFGGVAQVDHLLLNIVNFLLILKVNHLTLKMEKLGHRI